MIHVGIDVGTSGIKVIIANAKDEILAEADQSIDVTRLFPGWNEQQPQIWIDAITHCFQKLKSQVPRLLSSVEGIGLSGQMLGPVLIDQDDQPLCSTILWNDGRATEECELLLQRMPNIGKRTCSAPDPGFVAPKLLWLAKHEPEMLEKTDCLLLPKDFVRLWLTGERGTEPSDAGGTMFMDCLTRTWAEDLCKVVEWPLEKLPPIYPSWQAVGGLRAKLANEWGMKIDIPIAAGGGDNMVGTLGVGATNPGDTVITIGTSGVVCIVDSHFHPSPELGIVTSSHVVPKNYLSMGVVMSATSSVQWLSQLTNTPVTTLAKEAQNLHDQKRFTEMPLICPNYNGVRTPHNRADIRGAIYGISLNTDRGLLMLATMEGITFELGACIQAQQKAGTVLGNISVVGGGARNLLWCQMLASLLDRSVTLTQGREVAACLGAVRLARVASGQSIQDGMNYPAVVEQQLEPIPSLQDRLYKRLDRYQQMPLLSKVQM